MAKQCNNNSRVFHVGVGNSNLANRFSPLVSMIVGISIYENEISHALTINIDNYFPFLLNKYAMPMRPAFSAEFDFVVDNNPSGFCCCYFHFCRMMVAYRDLLRSNGQIITDREGLGWAAIDTSPRWRFDFEDWVQIADAVGLRAEDVDGSVYTMRSF
jgi:hypothetical protein